MALTWLAASVAVAYEPEVADDFRQDQDAALGINEAFGRWNSTVKLVYDPDDAPQQYISESKFLALLEAATQQWERVSGIRFDLLPADRNVPDDSNRPAFQQDGLVRVFWAAGNDFAGVAGPEFDAYNESLGYFPYYDGDIKLNNDPDTWETDGQLVATLVHELGHLIGLGHSDNPVSIMYANPYNHLRYPREDDIRAVQVLYGRGAKPVDAGRPLAEWVYPVPTTSASAASMFGNSFLSLQASPATTVATIDNSTQEDQFLLLNTGDFAGSIALDMTVVVVDPSGYEWGKIPWQVSCPPQNICRSSNGVITIDGMKTYPGTWRVLLVDESQGSQSASLIRSHSVVVASTSTYNQPPTGTVRFTQSDASTRVIFRLAASDKEQNGIQVIWHPPGPRKDRDGDGFLDNELTEALGSDGEALQTIDLLSAGTHTMFVELRDNGARYDGSSPGSSLAGSGFSNLLRLTVTLPMPPEAGQTQAMFPASSQTPPGTVEGIALKGQTMTNIVTNTGIATSAAFVIGASSIGLLGNSTTFSQGSHDVVIGGIVLPQAVDIGKAAEIFVVIRSFTASGESWNFRDSTGTFWPWPGVRIPELLAVAEATSLPASSAYTIFDDTPRKLGIGDHRIFIGYRVKGSNVLHYTGSAFRVQVTE